MKSLLFIFGIILIVAILYQKRLPKLRIEYIICFLLIYLGYSFFNMISRNEFFTHRAYIYIFFVSIGIVLLYKNSRVVKPDIIVNPIKQSNLPINHIGIYKDTKCGDGVCCFMPPPGLRVWFSDANLIFELKGGRIPPYLEPKYELGRGICKSLSFQILGYESRESVGLKIIARCIVYSKRPKSCRILPRGTNQKYCDYEKALWAPEDQISRQGCLGTLYYGFKLFTLRPLLWNYCKDQRLRKIIWKAAFNPTEDRIKFCWVWPVIQCYLLIRVPIKADIVPDFNLK